MKKLNKIIFCILTLLFSLTLVSCFEFYDLDTETYDNIVIGYQESIEKAYIGPIKYTMDNTTEIVLPSVYNDIKINALGGYMGRGFPVPFYVYFDLSNIYKEEDYSDVEYFSTDDISNYSFVEVITLDIYITLPDYLEELKKVDGSMYNCARFTDNNETVVKAVNFIFHFTISKDNEYFYTENGKLYYKDGTLVDKFNYGE